MGKKIVKPEHGKYTIHGKDNKNIDLTLESPDLDQFIVEELDGADMDDKLPASPPEAIRWYACFSIYKNKDGKKDGYATVTYSFPVSLDPGQKFYVAYNRQAYDKTDEVRRTGRVTMSEGDPATGNYP